MTQTLNNIRSEALSLLERTTRLKQRCGELTLPVDKARGQVGLEARDLRRQELVQEWVQVSAEVERMKVMVESLPSQLDTDGEVRRAAAGAVAAAESLQQAMSQHQKLTTKFPLPAASDAAAQMPYRLADIFVDNFTKSIIFPAAKARQNWKQLVADAQLNATFRAAVSAADDAEVASAEGKSIEASLHLRHQYNEWIPLLRFGFPELREKISTLIDKHCGMGSLRMDISTEDFVMTDLSVAGATARVFSATTKPATCTAKALKQAYCIKRFVNVDDFFRELEAMRVANRDGVSHPNIGEVEFAFEEGTGDHRLCFMAMPLYPMSSHEWFKLHGKSPANLGAMIRVLNEMVAGLTCLHSRGILHGDLKPDNIMMDGTGLEARPKLIDFNFSTVQNSGATNALRIVTAPIGVTADFAPPEFLEGGSHQRTQESDIYSLGKTFRVLLRDTASSSDKEKRLITQWLIQLASAMTALAPESRPALHRPTPGPAKCASVADRLKNCALLASLKADNASDKEDRTVSPRRYLEALNGSLTYSFEWWGLGYIMNGKESVSLNGQQYSQRQCYLEALKHDPKFTYAWNALGSTMSPNEQVSFNAANYTQRECYIEALKHDPKFYLAWFNLGALMSDNERVTVHGVSYTPRQCYIEALKHEPKCSLAWGNLGCGMDATETVKVNGVSYSQLQCMVEAVVHEPDVGLRWCNLANYVEETKPVQVNGISYTRQGCLIEALKHDPADGVAWFNLAVITSDPVQVNGKSYTKRECQLQAVSLDPTYATSWSFLAEGMNATEEVTVSEVRYTKRQCYLQALTLEPTHSTWWFNVGNGMTVSDRVTVNGTVFTKQQCFVEALKHDPNCSLAWVGLTTTLGATDQVNVFGTLYNRRQCYMEALKRDGKNSYAWNDLGALMNESERIQVNGVSYTKRQCFVEALKHGPTNYVAWQNMVEHLKPTEQVQIDGVVYTAETCKARHRELLQNDRR